MGKVHGSLARAGKVKSQTPKVRIDQHTNSTRFTYVDAIVEIGRATREEEAAQGPRLQASALHQAIRQCHHDGRQEEGKTEQIESKSS